VLKQNVEIGSFIRVHVTSHKPNFLVGEVVDKDLDEAEVIRLLEKENHASISLS
jgi:hypothetical protein